MLLICFLQWRAMPGHQELVRDVAQVCELVRMWCSTRVDFLHFPREQNVLSDWVCGLALELQQDVDMVSLAPDLRKIMAPIDFTTQILATFSGERDDVCDPKCEKCDRLCVSDERLELWGC